MQRGYVIICGREQRTNRRTLPCASGPARRAGLSGPESRTWFALPVFPWPSPFPPGAPPSPVVRPLGSRCCLVLRARPTSRRRSSRTCSFRILRADPAYRAWPTAGSPGVRTTCFEACMGSTTSRSPHAPRGSGARDVAFRTRERRRHSGCETFAAQYPAHIFPCKRLPCGLKAIPPWRGDSVVRYSFAVQDSHSPHPAGFARRFSPFSTISRTGKTSMRTILSFRLTQRMGAFKPSLEQALEVSHDLVAVPAACGYKDPQRSERGALSRALVHLLARSGPLPHNAEQWPSIPGSVMREEHDGAAL